MENNFDQTIIALEISLSLDLRWLELGLGKIIHDTINIKAWISG